MKNRRIHNKRTYLFGLVVLLAFPLAAFAQQSSAQFSSDGIFSCQGGQYAQSIGAQSATGGVYVPVADATVELNTGILVYKECILQPIIDGEKQAATSQFAKQALNTIQNGDNGGAYYVSNYDQEELGASDNGVIAYVQGGGLSTVNQAFQSQVQNAVVQAYQQATRNPQNDLACPYSGNLQDADDGDPDGSIWDALGALELPQCNPFFAAQLASEQLSAAAAQSVQVWQATQYDGFYPVTDASGNIVTPAYAVAQNYIQAEQSGINQLQMANDIGQMTNALFAGISNTILTPQGTQGAINQLNQASSQIQSSLIGSADNAAIAALNYENGIVSNYVQALNSAAQILTSLIGGVRNEENQCWSQVISAVCKTTPTANGTCEDASGNNLQIATSTEFSQPIINSQIAPLAQTVATELQNAQTMQSQLSQIESGVSNSTSNDVQTEALEQIDQFESNGQLPSSNDLATAQSQLTSAQQLASQSSGLMQQLATLWTGTDGNGNPTIAWSGSTSSPQGWCNVGSPSSNTAAATTISEWDALWKK